VKRLAPAALALALVAAGCGGTPNPQQKARADFLKQEKRLGDDELAALCPSLYPSDFLGDAGKKKYGYKLTKKKTVITAQDRANATRAGCTATGTKPKPK